MPHFPRKFPEIFQPVIASQVGPSAPVVKVYDTFTGADGTYIASRNPDVYVSGTWQHGSVGQISSNKCYIYNYNATQYIETLVSDCTITMDITLSLSWGGGGNTGFRARYTSDLDYWHIGFSHSAPTFRICEQTGGVFTERAAVAYTWEPGVTKELKVIFSGQSITASWGGAYNLSYTSSTHQDHTQHGFRSYHNNYYSPGDAYDNYRVTVP